MDCLAGPLVAAVELDACSVTALAGIRACGVELFMSATIGR